jgi:hypothetical protein
MAALWREGINAADPDIDFRKYDFIAILSAGKVWPHANCLMDAGTVDGLRNLRGFLVNENSEMGTYAHELAHILPSNLRSRGQCGLPDLYSYEAAENGLDASIWIGPWDLMDEDKPARHPSAWSKIALGWLTPETIRLTPTKALISNLQPLEQASGIRAIVVPVTSSKSYVIEVRGRIGYDQVLPAAGVLVYFADLSKGSGYGVLKVVDARPKTATLEDAPFRPGEIFEDSANKVYLAIAAAQDGGFMTVVAGSKIQSLNDDDRDGLLDSVEAMLGTRPDIPDTDGDGLTDGEEVNQYETNPLAPDMDGDGLTDLDELRTYNTDPKRADMDRDGLSDGDEILKHQTNPRKSDTDDDGLMDMEEVVKFNTDPLKADTDDDGLKDPIEVKLYLTDPRKVDSDDDGLSDAAEISRKTNPRNQDTDDDGLPDGREVQIGSSPLRRDTDADIWPDGTDLAPVDPLLPNILLVAVVALALMLVVVRRRRRATLASRMLA